MRYIFILFICCSFASCNNEAANTNSQTTETAVAAPKPQPQSNLGDAGTSGLMEVVKKYFVLKNALVATKAADANSAAGQLASQANDFLISLQNDSINKAHLAPYLDTIITASKTITSIDDKTCEKQRIVFEQISTSIYGLAHKAELKNAKIYHQYCPMAFNDKGAYWLSEESEIKNPYFGKKMLECGEVTDSL
ncbi:MAG: hypothetical protein K0Q79_1158 [Flavipsychrobacter sp.]|jgi:Cu(I)/Ag(I) efflux system membrane fusion protein|nr:hypothetical protein [Flavipsychrobacter sp.]